jgi:hypothetical protein
MQNLPSSCHPGRGAVLFHSPNQSQSSPVQPNPTQPVQCNACRLLLVLKKMPALQIMTINRREEKMTTTKSPKKPQPEKGEAEKGRKRRTSKVISIPPAGSLDDDTPPFSATDLPSTAGGTPTGLATKPHHATPLLLRLDLVLLLLLLPPGLGLQTLPLPLHLCADGCDLLFGRQFALCSRGRGCWAAEVGGFEAEREELVVGEVGGWARAG